MSQQPDSSPRITRRLETPPVDPARTPGDGSAGHADPSLEPDWSIVRRVEHESGSHVEPALDEDWPDLWKLRWHAAVVASVIGLRVQIDAADVKLNGVPLVGRYNIRCGSSAASVGNYQDAWTQLNGIETGAQQAIAAGWRPPAQVITDPAELDALPVGSVGIDSSGLARQRWRDRWTASGSTCTSRYLAKHLGPVTVLYTPTEETTR